MRGRDLIEGRTHLAVEVTNSESGSGIGGGGSGDWPPECGGQWARPQRPWCR